MHRIADAEHFSAITNIDDYERGEPRMFFVEKRTTWSSDV